MTRVAIVLVLGMAAAAIGFGLSYDGMSPVVPGVLVENYTALKDWTATYPVAAAVSYVSAYALLAVLFLPGSAMMAVAGGLLFGATVGLPLSWFASIMAASAAFFCAGALAGRVVPMGNEWPKILSRLRLEFGRHAFSYMVFLRVSPGLPFALVNAAPAVLAVPFTTFLAGTAVGLIPSRIALATAGGSLAGAIEAQQASYLACLARDPSGGSSCTHDVAIASLLTPQMVAAFVALAILALIPALIDLPSALRRRQGSSQDVETELARERDRDQT